MTSLRKILLATDLSARSDRAMDRAVLLANEREAELLALHVLEPVEDLGAAPVPPCGPASRGRPAIASA